MSGIGARDHRFGGNATGVDARAAKQMALNDRDLHPSRGQASGKRRTGLSGSDDDRVERGRHS